MTRSGFTLLEVVIALAILAIGLTVLVDSQSMAVFMTVDAGKTLNGTYLAQEKMAEAMLRLESEGFREGDIDEEGDFTDFGVTDQMGDAPDFGDSFEGYRWAYTIREVDIQIGDIASAADELEGMGGLGSKKEDAEGAPESRDLMDAGLQPDMLSDMLRPYIREVRVLIWWSEKAPDLEEGCDDCVELVSHVINPSGKIQLPVGG